MSMECDTRLSMMALQDNENRPAAPRHPNKRRFRTSTAASATIVASLATFALSLFTRSI